MQSGSALRQEVPCPSLRPAPISRPHKATSSVVFCLFMPTDKALRDACFAVGDGGKMMFGLVNRIAKEEPEITPTESG